MNGAESLVRTLAGAGVSVCFANPGTSEMQFVDALDRSGLMRCILGLFEGVVTGAADGYGRMTGRPAVTLLHLAPGLANGCANLHNAKKAKTPILNLVGDHALRHQAYDAPLSGDVAGTAAPFSDFVITARSAATIGAAGAEALAAAMSAPGRIATLIAPSDTGWDEGGVVAEPERPQGPSACDASALDAAFTALSQDAGPTLLYVGGRVLEDVEALGLLAAIAARTGCEVMAPTSNRRIERGAGRANILKVPYAVEVAVERLAKFRTAVLVEAAQPVGFFAYPGLPSLVLPEGCTRIRLADAHEDGPAAIRELAHRLGVAAPLAPNLAPPERPRAGAITAENLGAAIAAGLPEGAIVIDEGVNAGRGVYDACAGAPPMSWLAITGGSIGIGPPLSLGAAIACPERPVVAVQADGSAMYTFQALWTQAREGTNVTTVILANRGYEILKYELTKVGANPGRTALDMLEVARPELDFVALARGMGVPGRRVEDAAALSQAIADATREPGPFLIEAVLG